MRLKDEYNKVIIPKLIEKLGIKNIHAVPKVNKVIVNVGTGSIRENKKMVENILADLNIITGQKPSFSTSRKAISGFKLRQGDKVGLKVTLRKQRMYDFLERLVKITLPRIRDFRGLNKSGFDKNGNYNFGIKEHIVFPEIKYDKVDQIFGLQITINTSAKNDHDALELLLMMGFPFEKSSK